MQARLVDVHGQYGIYSAYRGSPGVLEGNSGISVFGVGDPGNSSELAAELKSAHVLGTPAPLQPAPKLIEFPATQQLLAI
jgi:hypothetical protein